MKKIALLVLICFAVLGWGMAIYENAKQDELARRLDDSILDKMQFMYEKEAQIKQEAESKKKAQEFIVQQEYERELRDSVVQQLEYYNQTIERYNQTQGLMLEQFNSTLGEKFAQTDKKAAELRQALQDSINQQDTYTQQMQEEIKNLEASLRQDLAKINAEITNRTTELFAEQKKLEAYGQKMRDYEQRLEEYTQQMLAIKKEQAQSAKPIVQP